MGWRFSGYFTDIPPDTDRIRAVLPAEIAFRVMLHPVTGLFGIDCYSAKRPVDWAFTDGVPTRNLPHELPPSLSVLQPACDRLGTRYSVARLLGGFATLATWISSAHDAPVLAIQEDDGNESLVCVAEKGELLSLTAKYEDFIASFSRAGGLQLTDLPPPENDEDEVDNPRRLHANALEALNATFGVDGGDMKIGYWDAPEHYGFVPLPPAKSSRLGFIGRLLSPRS